MDVKVAERLVTELERHSRIVTPDRRLFLDELALTEIPEPFGPFQTLPGKTQLVTEGRNYYYLSLRRLLNNREARLGQMSLLRRIYNAVISTPRAYSSNSLIRGLMTDSALVDLMKGCSEPFSLLGKFQSYELNTVEVDGETHEDFFVVTRPVLVIPGTKDMRRIHGWEEENTRYGKEVRLMGFVPIQKRIKPQKYFSS
jgi:hypothetical protein